MIGSVVDKLDADILQAIDHLGGTVDTAEEITRLRGSRSRKACFQVRLTDGRTVKGRRFKSAAMRESVTELHSVLEGLPLSRILATHGAATIEEWVPGDPIEPGDMDHQITRELAIILGKIHCSQPPLQRSHKSLPGVDWHADRLRLQLTQLANHGHIDSQTVTRLIDLAINNQPAELENGVVHTDFHPGNMIRKRNGEIWIIDNERIRLGAFEYDVARCWTYWPMTRGQRETFCKAYSGLRSLDSFLAHQQFWSVCTLVNTTRVYMRFRQSIQSFLNRLAHISQHNGKALWPELLADHE